MFNLIPYLNVAENITLPGRLNRRRELRLAGSSLDAAVVSLAQRLEIESLLDQPDHDQLNPSASRGDSC